MAESSWSFASIGLVDTWPTPTREEEASGVFVDGVHDPELREAVLACEFATVAGGAAGPREYSARLVRHDEPYTRWFAGGHGWFLDLAAALSAVARHPSVCGGHGRFHSARFWQEPDGRASGRTLCVQLVESAAPGLLDRVLAPQGAAAIRPAGTGPGRSCP